MIDTKAHAEAFDTLFEDESQVDYLAKSAVYDALHQHKRLGQSVVVWQDGKVVTLAPEDIPDRFPDTVPEEAA